MYVSVGFTLLFQSSYEDSSKKMLSQGHFHFIVVMLFNICEKIVFRTRDTGHLLKSTEGFFLQLSPNQARFSIHITILFYEFFPKLCIAFDSSFKSSCAGLKICASQNLNLIY